MRSLIEESFPTWGEAEKDEVEIQMWAYVFRLQHFVVSKKRLKHLTHSRPLITLKNKVLDTGKIMIEDKFVIAMCIHYSLFGTRLNKYLSKLDKEYLIPTLWLIHKSNYSSRFQSASKKVVKNLGADNVEDMLKLIKVWTSKFVYRKFSFLIRANRWDASDVENELFIKAVQTFNYLYGFDTGAKLLNTVKRAIHNYGISFIVKHTTQKRGRIVAEGCGFVNKQESIEYQDSGDLRRDIPIDCSAILELEDRICQRQLFSSFQDRERRIAQALLCYDKDTAFIEWLEGQYPNMKHQGYNLTDFQRKIGVDSYNKKIRKFFKASPVEVLLIVRRLGRDLNVRV